MTPLTRTEEKYSKSGGKDNFYPIQWGPISYDKGFSSKNPVIGSNINAIELPGEFGLNSKKSLENTVPKYVTKAVDQKYISGKTVQPKKLWTHRSIFSKSKVQPSNVTNDYDYFKRTKRGNPELKTDLLQDAS